MPTYAYSHVIIQMHTNVKTYTNGGCLTYWGGGGGGGGGGALAEKIQTRERPEFLYDGVM